MQNEEDPVHAAIPPGRTAGQTAARTAVTAADLHRPVPRRQGTRGACRGTRLLAAPPPAYLRLRAAVLITSRISKDWLGGIRRMAVGGLASHEAAGYAGNSWGPTWRRRSGRDERGRFVGARR
jgi:hypothetical protein